MEQTKESPIEVFPPTFVENSQHFQRVDAPHIFCSRQSEVSFYQFSSKSVNTLTALMFPVTHLTDGATLGRPKNPQSRFSYQFSSNVVNTRIALMYLETFVIECKKLPSRFSYRFLSKAVNTSIALMSLATFEKNTHSRFFLCLKDYGPPACLRRR